jgi:pimeloyl-ACP methyl ester carboxylesterase
MSIRRSRTRTTAATFGALLALAAAGLTGCSGDEPSNDQRNDPAAAPARSTPADDKPISGLFPVNGHRLFLNCSAGRSPAVVFVADLARTGDDGDLLAARLPDDRRFCRYDRASLGVSTAATPAGGGGSLRTTGGDAVSDLHQLLNVAGVRTPVVLVGAGFGGLLATLHAAEHPEDVAGLVLADPVLPSEWDLLTFLPAKDAGGFKRAWESNSELLAVERTLEQARTRADRLPDVPLVLIDARHERTPSSWDWPAIEAAHAKQVAAFVRPFTHRTVIKSDAPPPLENEAPEKVVSQVNAVLAAVG